jgi:hypothetical protein
VRSVVHDAGVLVAADKSVRRAWADHRVRLEAGILPMVPATVVAQVSRSAKQVQLRRLLAGCEIVALGDAAAHRVGALLARSRTSDVVDASVVDLASIRHADVVTSDPKDLRRLMAASADAAEMAVFEV